MINNNSINEMEFDSKILKTLKSLHRNIIPEEAEVHPNSELGFKTNSFYQSFKNKKINGVQFYIDRNQREDMVHVLRYKLGNQYMVYFSEENYHAGSSKIVILPYPDQYIALQFEGTSGLNHNIYVEDVIKHLKRIEKENPFIITGVGIDFVQDEFSQTPRNLEQLAYSMYDFCPDIVDQGTGSIEGLMDEIRWTNMLYYWWD